MPPLPDQTLGTPSKRPWPLPKAPWLRGRASQYSNRPGDRTDHHTPEGKAHRTQNLASPLFMETTPEARVTDFPASDLYMFSQLGPRVSNPCLSSAAPTGLNVLPTRACFLRGEVGRNTPAGYTIKVLNSSTHPGSGRREQQTRSACFQSHGGHPGNRMLTPWS